MFPAIWFAMAATAVATQSWPPEILPHNNTFERSVRAGGEVRVFTYARWKPGLLARQPAEY